jgi:NAD-dependent DNA ligase
MEYLQDFQSEPFLFVEENDINTIVKLAKYASKEFFNGVSVMEDAEYDLLIDTIKELDPKHPLLEEI